MTCEDWVEVDPKFGKMIDVFFCKISPDELTEDERHVYAIFYAGAAFMQQYTMTMAVYKLDPEEGMKMYMKLFHEDAEIVDAILDNRIKVNGEEILDILDPIEDLGKN